jgi:hypothetical protein
VLLLDKGTPVARPVRKARSLPPREAVRLPRKGSPEFPAQRRRAVQFVEGEFLMKKFAFLSVLLAGALAFSACNDLANDPLGPQFVFQDTDNADLITAQGNCVDNGDGTGASGASGKLEDGWDDGDAFLMFSAPAGYLIYKVCVKAGSGGALIIDVDPPSATHLIDHPTVNSVSHFVAYYMEDPNIEEIGEWCSPGFWRNNPIAVSETGVDMDDLYSDHFDALMVSARNISRGAVADPTLQQVLESPQWYGGEAFNNVGDLLSEAHPDVEYEGERVEDSCPLAADASRR